MFRREDEGDTHINVYSKSLTRLGHALSNFARTPFTLDGHTFESVEGYWYWVMTGDDRLKSLYGWKAKDLGQRLPQKREHPTKEELLRAYKAKLEAHPDIKELLKENTLPLTHYYVYGNTVVVPTEWQWTVELWKEAV